MTVDILILGAGWTSTFLVPLCNSEGISYAATSRKGSDSTIPFDFPETADFSQLPDATTILVTFPLKKGWAARLVDGYGRKANWIALGSTGMWSKGTHGWQDRHSPYAPNDRAAAEEEFPGAVLNLAGLWGNLRTVSNMVERVAPSKEALAAKV